MGQRWTRTATLCVVGLVMLVMLVVAQPLVPGAPRAAASTGDPRGAQTTNNFWLATESGDVYTFGVESYGDPGGAPLNRPIVTMVPTKDRHGYWLVASDGGVFSYGDAAVLRVQRRHRPQPPHRGHEADQRRERLLAGGLRRRDLLVRGRHLLRLHRRHRLEPAHRGHGRDARRQGVLAGGVRRRGVLLR